MDKGTWLLPVGIPSLNDLSLCKPQGGMGSFAVLGLLSKEKAKVRAEIEKKAVRSCHSIELCVVLSAEIAKRGK
jgi:hypothetical protein